MIGLLFVDLDMMNFFHHVWIDYFVVVMQLSYLIYDLLVISLHCFFWYHDQIWNIMLKEHIELLRMLKIHN